MLIRLIHGDHVGFESVRDRPRLLAGTTMRLVDRDRLPGALLPLADEGSVVVLETPRVTS